MSRTSSLLALTVGAVWSGMALADSPSVATDIAPIHSLVARVMDGVGNPDLIIPAEASPHEYSLRPSEARAIQNADLVFWMGQELTPWMSDAVSSLAPEAQVVGFLDADQTQLLDIREGALFDTHDHGHEDHANSEKDDAHGHDHGHDHEHDHGNHDAHAWLSPDNAKVWLGLIAETLAAKDPENAALYAANAEAGVVEIVELEARLRDRLAPLGGKGFIVFHDAYQYFEEAFGISASGAIALSDATDPSPARLAEIHARLKSQDISCVLSEPQFNPGIIASVADGADVRSAVADPIGVGLEPGPGLYGQMLEGLAAALEGCLRP